ANDPSARAVLPKNLRSPANTSSAVAAGVSAARRDKTIGSLPARKSAIVSAKKRGKCLNASQVASLFLFMERSDRLCFLPFTPAPTHRERADGRPSLGRTLTELTKPVCAT